MRGSLCLALSCVAAVVAQSPWSPASAAAAQSALQQLTLEQKISLVHGHSIFDVPYVGNVPGIVLNDVTLPPLNLEDGPSGAADALSDVTCWPNAGTVLQSWDREMLFAFGEAMGLEQWLKGTNVALAPAVNLVRVPWGGRAFEYLGEDAVLASAAATELVRGLQTHNISACVKHAFLNAQETNRNTVSENAEQLVLEELYYPPFRAAVNAGVGFAMCSYNRVNGVYACENNATILDLKASFGFAGAVMSDWYATHSAAPAALAGLDQEMPGGFYFSTLLQQAVASGAVPLARLDDMVLRILTPAFALGLVADPPDPARRNILSNATSPAHAALARALAQASIVLLQNSGGLLPLTPALTTSVRLAVFGDEGTVSGHGSGGVTLPYLVTPTAGLRAALAAAGSPATVTYYPLTLSTSAAAAAAAASDYAIVVVATTSSEGLDRADLALPAAHNALAAAVAGAQPRTAVVVRSPGACTMPWLHSVPAVLFEGMAGQESGSSLAQVLLGLASPSGKLTLSFPASENHTWLSASPGGPVDPRRYPGTDRGRGFPESDYSEGLLMGWPYFEAHPQVPVLFPFGHGLSYASFVWGRGSLSQGGVLSASNASSSLVLTLQLGLAPGSVGGAEVVQLYAGAVQPPPGQGQPPRRLLDFSKVALTPGGGEAAVQFVLTAQQFARYSQAAGRAVVPTGTFQLDLGSSSRDIQQSLTLTIVA